MKNPPNFGLGSTVLFFCFFFLLVYVYFNKEASSAYVMKRQESHKQMKMLFALFDAN